MSDKQIGIIQAMKIATGNDIRRCLRALSGDLSALSHSEWEAFQKNMKPMEVHNGAIKS